MNTNMTGFRCFSKIFASLCFGGKYSLKIGRVKVNELLMLRLLICPKHKEAKIFENHLNPGMLVFIG